MKHILFILSFTLVSSLSLFAQDSTDVDDGNEKIQDKMSEYIQKRLDLTKDEASKFTPIFIKYFKEWRQTIRQYRSDKLVLQNKISELRLRFRPQFREILGERRGDQVFNHQDRFIKELKDIMIERRLNNRGGGNKPLRR
jgi:hypothetical protein